MLWKLVWNNIRKNKKRSLSVIFGIAIIATAIFTTIIFLASYQQYMINVVKEKNNWEAKISNISKETANKIENNPEITQVSKTCLIAEETIESNIYMDYIIKLYSCDQPGLENLNFQLKTGKLPQNAKEIAISQNQDNSENLFIGQKGYQLGEKITLNNQEYTIVGILESSPYDQSSLIKQVYGAITYWDEEITQNLPMDIYVSYQSLEKIEETNQQIIKEEGIQDSQITYNKPLLQYHLIEVKGQNAENTSNLILGGVPSNEFKQTMHIIGIGTLGVLGIIGFIVLYEIFYLFISSRQKEMGTLRSIGFTKKQIVKMLLLEELVLASFAIGIAFLISNGLIKGIFAILNPLSEKLILSDRTFFAINTQVKLTLYYHGKAILISILYLVITMWIANILPIKQAKKVQPIEAIKSSPRQIKNIKNKKHKSHQLFGIEGKIASQYRKANRKNTILIITAIAITNMVFIIISNYIENIGAYITTENRNYNYLIYVKSEEDYKKLKEEIEKENLADSYYTRESITQFSLKIPEDKIHSELMKFTQTEKGKGFFRDVVERDKLDLKCNIFTILEEQEYKNLLELLNIKELKEQEAVLLNEIDVPRYVKMQITNYKEGETIQVYRKDLLQENQIYDLLSPEMQEWTKKSQQEEKQIEAIKEIPIRLNKVSNTMGKYFTYPDWNSLDNSPIAILVSPKTLQNIQKENIKQEEEYYQSEKSETHQIEMYLQSDKTEILDNYIENNLKNTVKMNFQNNIDSNKSKETFLKILAYSFMSFVAISVFFSIFNMIYADIQARQADFGILKSLGMSKKQIRKMITAEGIYETVFSLTIGILLGIGIFIGIYQIQNKQNLLYDIVISKESIVFCILFTTIVIFSSLGIAKKSINKKDIISTIKKEV